MGIITPHGPSMTSFGSPQETPGQQLFDNLQALSQSPYSPAQQALAAAMIKAVGGPPYDYAAMTTEMNTILNENYGTSAVPIDAYMHFGVSKLDATSFFNEVNNQISGTGPYVPPITVTEADDNYAGMYDNVTYAQPPYPAVILAINNAYLASFAQNIGSLPSVPPDPYPTQLAEQLLTNIFTDPNFFSTYSGVTYNVLHTYLSNVMTAYAPPDFFQNFIQMGTAAWDSSDAVLQSATLGAIRGIWEQNPPGTLKDVQTWANWIIWSGFSDDYAACDVAGANQLESLLGIDPSSTPPLQTQYLETRTWLATLTSTPPSAVYKVVKSLNDEIYSNYVNGTPGDVEAWYNLNYPASAAQDIFMKLYNVDPAAVQQFYEYATNSTSTLTVTPADNNYRAAANYRDKFISDPTGADYKLMDALCTQWSANGGSNPTAAQQQTNLSWQFSVIDDPTDPLHALYTSSSAETQAQFNIFTSDPEGQALHDLLVNTEALFFGPLVNAVLTGIQGPPWDHVAILNAIKNVFGQTYTDPSTGRTCDVFMQFNLSSTLGNVFVSQINATLSKVGSTDTCPPLPTYTSQDAVFGAIVDWCVQQPLRAPMLPLAQDFLAGIRSNIGSSGDMSVLPTLFTVLMTEPNFFTTFPTITPANFSFLQAFVTMVNGSGGMNYVLPDFTLQYLQVGCSWRNPNTNTDDTKLQQDLLTQMRADFGSNATYYAALQGYAVNIIAGPVPQPTPPVGGFLDYPILDINGAVNLETFFSIPAPSLQVPFFETRAWLAGLPAGTPANAMATGLKNEINSLWPFKALSDLTAWYNTTYASTGSVDPFMQFYNADVDSSTFPNINQFYQIATGSTGTITITPTDINVRDAANYRDNFAQTAPQWKLMNDYVNYWVALNSSGVNINGGSNPTPGQLLAAAHWAETEIGTLQFSSSDTVTQQKFIGYFSTYSVALTYLKEQLISWGGSTAPLYKQEFAETMRQIISGFIETHPNSTQQQFQDFISDKFSNNDYCFICPGITPNDVLSLFSPFITFTAESGKTIFPPVDTVFANIYNALQAATQPADQKFLQGLYDDTLAYRNNPSQQSLSSILYQMCMNANSMSQYQTSTQNAINDIFRYDSAITAYAGVFQLLQNAPVGSIDAQVFASLFTSVGQSVDDPVNYPYSSTFNAAILAIYNDPAKWNALQAGSQLDLITLVSLIPLFNPI